MKKVRLMNRKWKIPPANRSALSSPAQLATRLQALIGRSFPLTRISRTDGSNLRKLVAATLENHSLPKPASAHDFEIIPPRRKGVPKILREFIDTYIVTTGDVYNLQVWNRNPASESVQVQFSDGSHLSAKDVRFVLVPIDPETERITSIVILTSEYIETRFGRFGKPTIKQQLLVAGSLRDYIVSMRPPVFVGDDTSRVNPMVTDDYASPSEVIRDSPQCGRLFSLKLIAERTSRKLLGKMVPPDVTKNRGQNLERLVDQVLGYNVDSGILSGGYPDIANQLLEVKIQDSQTVDLGRFSPQFEEPVPEMQNDFTTRDVRYLMALTDPTEHTIDGLILLAGEDLGKHFTYVADDSFKCQRSIPMDFFKSLNGKSVFNP